MLARFSSPERKVERLSRATANTLASLAKHCAGAILNDPRAENWSESIHETKTRVLPGTTRDDRPAFPGTDLTVLDLWAREGKAPEFHNASVQLLGDTGEKVQRIQVGIFSNDYSPAFAGIADTKGRVFSPQPNNFIDVERPVDEAWTRAAAKVRRLELSAAAIVAVSVGTCTGVSFDRDLERMTKLHNKLSAFLGEEPVAEGVPLWQATPLEGAQPLLAPPVPHDAVA